MVPGALVFGIGNPGSEYDGTRHNVGFAVLDGLLARHGGAPFRTVEGLGVSVSMIEMEGRRLLLAKPTTFVNRSGPVLRDLRDGHGLSGAALLVIVDDLALAVGRIRLRAQGSDGGHNGLKSIAAALGTEQYARLRIGIGNERARAVPEFVLARVPDAERPMLAEAVLRAADAVDTWVRLGIERAMGVVNAPSDLDRPQSGA